jgi:hypothetical protein
LDIAESFNSSSFLFCDEISTQREMRVWRENIDLRFHECAKKRENSGDFAGFCEPVAPKCGRGL